MKPGQAFVVKYKGRTNKLVDLVFEQNPGPFDFKRHFSLEKCFKYFVLQRESIKSVISY